MRSRRVAHTHYGLVVAIIGYVGHPHEWVYYGPSSFSFFGLDFGHSGFLLFDKEGTRHVNFPIRIGSHLSTIMIEKIYYI